MSTRLRRLTAAILAGTALSAGLAIAVPVAASAATPDDSSWVIGSNGTRVTGDTPGDSHWVIGPNGTRVTGDTPGDSHWSTPNDRDA
ncbi:hypothetical protein [Nonomuraea sp. NPDC050786]|uniref:hypothetical protein n=1 Tax=Nonomuraea sp. NPDC050786 TaxID=3154840 RepID=UPI0033DC8FFE